MIVFIVTAPSSDTGDTGGEGGGSSGGGSITGRATEEVVCNPPYIRYEKGCCLDSNNNSICDRDEEIQKSPEEENKIKEDGIAGEETPKKESRLFESIKNLTGKIGSFFSSIGKRIPKNKNYLFIGFIVLILILLFTVSLIIFFRRKRKYGEISKIKFKLQHLRELNERKKITNSFYHKEREKLLQKINNLLENKKVFLFIGISGVIGAVLFLFKLNITGGAIGVGNFVKNNWIFESVILIVLVLGFIIILEKTKKRKIKDTTKLSNTKGMLVYSSDGDKIGKIKEIYLDNNNHKIDKWLICVDKEIAKKIKKKNILIKHESVKSIKEIMIVDGRISEHLETFKE